ncbi:conserved hypothetical protein [uncultured Desulfobacterium sp.]|uniref:Uncharacterized protein n=1 Tax=uncultured Desulfobacterium sp. TaxID=201089 RepID=A0A445N318_9BACT|nr:conserved hypothetical protein [uncultured Desulfobacterium sp.]
MGFTVEQECPQCGGRIDLDETDHILRCPYCGTENYLYSPDYFRFVLPHKSLDKEVVYAPYLRFKGNVYYCMDLNLGQRVVDITHIGVSLNGIPSSLGLRPQAMKMKFVSQSTQGSFLKFSLKATDIVKKAAALTSSGMSGRLYHRAFIGESISLIYMPFFVQGGDIFDAILNRPIAVTREDAAGFPDQVSASKWKISFIPTLCPQCGWNFTAEKDSVVLLCGNCSTAWEVSEGRFQKVQAFTVEARKGTDAYLPFWKISAAVKGLDIASFADFIRVTNQPIVISGQWENEEMCFWSPAFKIRPKVFLQLSKQVTVFQRLLSPVKLLPKKNLHPVTMPVSEAEQAMKIILAASAVTKNNVFPFLPEISFEVKGRSLVYLPFTDTGSDMVLQDARISVNRQALEYGRRL